MKSAGGNRIWRRELLLLIPVANIAFLVIWLASAGDLGALPMVATSVVSALSLIAYLALAALSHLKVRGSS
ncbi:MAG: hypothetical protein E6Q40_01395 [Cupriavidus sp.]|nr:MAG: hypothetical protein E6Q40_01395 [Cupriavidus sp.]